MKKALKRCRVFPERSVHEFNRLKALITLEEVNTSVVQKKKKNLYEQSFDGEANNNKQIAMLIQVNSSQYILILKTSRISGFTFLKSSKIWLC